MIFFNKSKRQVELIQINSDDFILNLINIKSQLNVFEHKGQIEFLDLLLFHLNNQNYFEFHKSLLSADMWGGSGAVWEVEIFDKNKMILVQKYIIDLINLMEECKIKKMSIKSIRKLFLGIQNH